MELRIAEIMRILPHRHPFLLVDRVIEVDPDKRIVALKNVSINEPFFNGHFPGTPVMPGGSARGAMLGGCGSVDRLQSAVATRGVRRAAPESGSDEQTRKCDSRESRDSAQG